MIDQSLPLDSATTASRAVHAVRPEGLAAVLAGLPAAQAEFARGAGFKGTADELLLLPGEGGVAAALLGLGANRGPFAFGGLPFRLPEGAWHLVPGDYDGAQAELGFLLGAYRYSNFKRAPRAPARLAGASHAAAQAHDLRRELAGGSTERGTTRDRRCVVSGGQARHVRSSTSF